MRTITIKRLSLQFNTNRKGRPFILSSDMLEEINVALRNGYPDEQPQITIDGEDFDPNQDITVLKS